MKDKISTIILLAIFIALLVIIYNLTSKQAVQSNISENLVNNIGCLSNLMRGGQQ